MTVEPLRVLIVDDNVDSAMMMRTLLRFEGHLIRVEFDGAAAVDAAGEFAPDVILMDLSLPTMSGADAASAIRAAHASSGREIVAVTGHGEEALPRPSPFDRFFHKPVDHDALIVYLEGIKEGLGRKPPSGRAVA